MKREKNTYTQKETFEYKKRRNQNSILSSRSRFAGYIWDSNKGTFKGSIRSQFTGPRRNNFQTIN